ncbi:MAG: helix-turn-helix domain-containing protein [Butyricicoccus pullicaecorum]|nr:helix-turn-helix domain-containing protein [Butyricicoccus pullicaecorum]
MREFFTVREVAQRWKMKNGAVYQYIASGRLRASKFGKAWRIELADIERFEDQLRRESGMKLQEHRIGAHF